MKYRNTEMKIDQLVSYLNEEKINLSPAFQRGHVWNTKTRRELMRNIVMGRPIPAIFLYKEAVGSKYTYNILDGKQRIETIILFITNTRKDVRVEKWSRYIFEAVHRKAAGFPVELPDGKLDFAALPDEVLRDFREYSMPVIEITLDDASSLDEVISLFVDINQQGEPVNRFDIVKAMFKNDALMKGVFGLLALEQSRGQDVHYKPKRNEFTNVLKRLQVIENVHASNSKVDKMWEKLLELSLFARTKEHRKPVAILKEFIARHRSMQPKLKTGEIAELRRVFRFMEGLAHSLGDTRIFTDQVHSYTVVTSLLRTSLLDTAGDVAVAKKLRAFVPLLNKGVHSDKNINRLIARYIELSTKQTTDVSRRTERDTTFIQLLDALPA